MKEKLTATGAIVAAVLASSCCWLPLLLVGLGASGAGLAAAIAPLRPFLFGLTVLLLAGAWVFTLHQSAAPAAVCGAEGACCPPLRGRPVLFLALVTFVAAGMLAIPNLANVVADSKPMPRIETASGPLSTATLAIQGMTCEACEGHIRDSLVAVPGVKAAEVDFKTASARVTFVKGNVPSPKLVEAVRRAGYKATVESREPNVAAKGHQ